MNGLQLTLQAACRELDLLVEFDKTIDLDDGLHVEAPAHILSSGARMGRLIFTDTSAVWPFMTAIRGAGFGFSVMDNQAVERPVDVEGLKDVFNDCDWSGDAAHKPLWTREN